MSFKTFILKKRIAIGERMIIREVKHATKCLKYVKEQMQCLDNLKQELEDENFLKPYSEFKNKKPRRRNPFAVS